MANLLLWIASLSAVLGRKRARPDEDAPTSLMERDSRLQLSYLNEPNIGAAMVEYAAIQQYLRETCGRR
jgi:hypothetical protein